MSPALIPFWRSLDDSPAPDGSSKESVSCFAPTMVPPPITTSKRVVLDVFVQPLMLTSAVGTPARREICSRRTFNAVALFAGSPAHPAIVSSTTIGLGVGAGVGKAVGVGVGALVGALVGDRVGGEVGAAVGAAVGPGVGALVGSGVGDEVGDGVGAGVVPGTYGVGTGVGFGTQVVIGEKSYRV